MNTIHVFKNIAGQVWSTSKLTTLHGRQIKVPRFILRTGEKQLSLFSFLTFPVKQNFPLYFLWHLLQKTNIKKIVCIKYPQPQLNDLNNCKWRTFEFESLELPTQKLTSVTRFVLHTVQIKILRNFLRIKEFLFSLRQPAHFVVVRQVVRQLLISCPKLCTPSTLKIDLILWHTQLIVCAQNFKACFFSC